MTASMPLERALSLAKTLDGRLVDGADIGLVYGLRASTNDPSRTQEMDLLVLLEAHEDARIRAGQEPPPPFGVSAFQANRLALELWGHWSPAEAAFIDSMKKTTRPPSEQQVIWLLALHGRLYRGNKKAVVKHKAASAPVGR